MHLTEEAGGRSYRRMDGLIVMAVMELMERTKHIKHMKTTFDSVPLIPF
jgi:hypothetical protein